MTGDDVILEADAGGGHDRVRLGQLGPAQDVDAPREVRKGSAVVRGIRFVLAGPADEADAGLIVTGFSNVRIEDCSFIPFFPKAGSGPAALALPTRVRGRAAEVFRPRRHGVAIRGPGELTAEHCAIAPHQSAVG